MIGGLGPWEIFLLILLVLLIFGAKRLPELGGALGKGIREFRQSVRDMGKDELPPAEPPKRELPPSDERVADDARTPGRAADRPREP